MVTMEKNNFVALFLTVIITSANTNSCMELSQNIVCLRQTVSRLPNFELLIMQREQKFIHPSLMQPHLVPLHFRILEHGPWPSASNNGYNGIVLAATGDKIPNKEADQQKWCNHMNLKVLTAPRASNGSDASFTSEWMFRSIGNHLRAKAQITSPMKSNNHRSTFSFGFVTTRNHNRVICFIQMRREGINLHQKENKAQNYLNWGQQLVFSSLCSHISLLWQ